jgi:hypothetical protein
MKDRLLTVKTTRYSEFFRRLFEEYTDDSVATIDGRDYRSADFPSLMGAWFTNAKIKATQDFRLRKGGKELFGFHDGPVDIWAAPSELKFLQQLADEKIIHVQP